MAFAHTVQRGSRRGNASTGSLLAKRATAQPVWGDILGSFTAAALRSRPHRICLVTPWLSETDHARLRLLVGHANAHGAELILVTRPLTAAEAERAINVVRRARSHRILLNEQLHAKLYICQESDGRGVALVGSANLTAGGTRLAEVGVLLRPLGGSRLMDDLALVAMTYLGGARAGRRTR